MTLTCVEITPDSPPAYAVIWLHGLGADGHDFEAIVPELDIDPSLPVRWVFPNAPMRPVTINGGMVMRAWYDIREADLSRGVDTDGIHESSRLLTHLIQKEIDAGIPSDRIVLAGFSQGGVIVLHTGLRHATPLAGILALSTYCPTVTDLAAERSDSNLTTPILMAHGRFDPLIPISIAAQTRDALVKLDYSLQWREYPMQHEVCMQQLHDISAWMRTVMH